VTSTSLCTPIRSKERNAFCLGSAYVAQMDADRATSLARYGVDRGRAATPAESPTSGKSVAINVREHLAAHSA